MGKWYILHVRTGYEERIRKLLEKQLNAGETQRLENIVIPTEEVAEFSGGKKEIKSKRYWPGYMLVEIAEPQNNDLTWHTIRATTGVLGFLGAGATPVPLNAPEVEKILKELEDKKSKPTLKVEFEPKDKVEIIEGPFVNFSGVVEEVYPERERLKVSITIFGRATSLELNYWQVERTS